MKVKCEYCDHFIDDALDVCPHCGAPNLHARRSGSRVPQTLEELQAYCAARKMPLEKMRFFLGTDYKGPRAFGIYEENGNFIVYKNKSDGSRAVRYRGTDEAYAVNEIYQKLKEEITNQERAGNIRRVGPTGGTRSGGGQSPRPRQRKKRFRAPLIIFVAVFGFYFLLGLFALLGKTILAGNNGYYRADDTYYYYDAGNWYYYDEAADYWYDAGDPGIDVSDPSYQTSSSAFTDTYGSDVYLYDDYDADTSSGSWSSGSWDSGDWDSDDWDSSDWDSDDWDDDDYDYDDWDSGSSDWDSDW